MEQNGQQPPCYGGDVVVDRCLGGSAFSRVKAFRCAQRRVPGNAVEFHAELLIQIRTRTTQPVAQRRIAMGLNNEVGAQGPSTPPRRW